MTSVEELIATSKAALGKLSDFGDDQWEVFYSSETKEAVSFGPDNHTEQFSIDGMSEDDAQFAADSPARIRALIEALEAKDS